MPFTDIDLRNAIYETLGEESGDFDVTAIADDIQREYGTVHPDAIPAEPFWDIVKRHDIS